MNTFEIEVGEWGRRTQELHIKHYPTNIRGQAELWCSCGHLHLKHKYLNKAKTKQKKPSYLIFSSEEIFFLFSLNCLKH